MQEVAAVGQSTQEARALGIAILLGCATSALVWWCWGQVSPPPTWHDESAYLLQAKLFASGRWTGPARPLPEFFQQYHLLVSPKLAAKYPPGHSLALTPGVLLGIPALMPVLLSGITGALVFTLARRMAGLTAGLLTWLLLVLAPMNLEYRPSFMSEVTSAWAVVTAWWALLAWKRCGSTRWLVAVFVAFAWCAITRPVTALAFAVPVLPVLLPAMRQAGIRPWSAAAAGGLGILALLPIWSWRTTGDWRVTPLGEYTRAYMPWDRMGFGLDSTPPAERVRSGVISFSAPYLELHRQHTLESIPGTLALRAGIVLEGAWGRALPMFYVLSILGLLRIKRSDLVAVFGGLALILFYLIYAHFARWEVYYLELLPVTAYLPALGLHRTLSLLPRAGPLILSLIVVFWVAAGYDRLSGTRQRKLLSQEHFTDFESRLQGLGSAKAIVFVRYAPDHDEDNALVTNTPELRSARFWVVHDLAEHNELLMRQAPEREAFLYDASSREFIRLSH